MFAFRTRFSDLNGAETPPEGALLAYISYPNFLTKQQKYKKKSERVIGDKEGDKNKNNRGYKTETPDGFFDENLITATWDRYQAEYEKTYGVTPIRNDHQIDQIRNLIARVGDKAPIVVAAYLKYHKPFYIDRQHTLDVCVEDAESIYTAAMQNGMGGV